MMAPDAPHLLALVPPLTTPALEHGSPSHPKTFMPAVPLSAAFCATEALGLFPHFLWSPLNVTLRWLSLTPLLQTAFPIIAH